MSNSTEVIASHNPYPVTPTGYLMGSYFCLLVIWIWVLSSVQVVLVLVSSWKYFVDGLTNTKIWGEFWWPLSIQDALLYFGRRAWQLMGKKMWLICTLYGFSTLTLFCGWALAITGRLWADNPYSTNEEFRSRVIGVPSQVVAILWMGLSAAIDGCITCMLLYRFSRARHSISQSTRTLVRRMMTLTLSTVLLTHIVGGVMCIIFIASPSSHRTKSNFLWVLLELITELYALSAVFTINSRVPRSSPSSLYENGKEEDGKFRGGAEFPMTQTALDRQVEGYQGSTPFGVRVTFSSRCQRNKNGKKSGADGALVTHEDAVPALSAEGTRIPDTPTAELTGEEAGQKRSWA
ncbi:hypothetical protein CNBM2230 [Cryptococcus deneoformans B-3501A]|uniref:hypothetical protein n=1 Tax=Cryptococcus deneoformans (strain B-3501A) TaxID=283643 RepID=UPI000042F47F|nr:hypothetical protein CNBM2230 [Cryptococcus neoformans var. neoformans B-3501A]EAL17419.1 hypothetical protein CNBM2230 [Cryptococcus neoformans var. neoformans B-3501A]